jgi:D-aminoacyl-tRNA deacylase
MRAVIQRVSSASVAIDGAVRGQIGPGLLVLLGIAPGDGDGDIEWLAQKLAKLRIFTDEQGHMNKSVLDIDGGVLVVSQFTLFASTRKGTRPSFNDAAPPEEALPLYRDFLAVLRNIIPSDKVHEGEFGALMQINLVNDGPVTLIVDTNQRD